MKVNEKIANFRLKNQDDETVQLTDFAGKPVILFSIPGRILQAAPLKHAAFATRLPSCRKRAQ